VLCPTGCYWRGCYWQVSSNNTAETALEAFLTGVNQYGLPYRVGTDRGSENVRIAEYTLHHRGTGHGSIIMGRSVHNQKSFLDA